MGSIFILRSSGVSLIGELTFIILINFMTLYGMFPLDDILNITISSLLLNLLLNIVLIIPSNIIIDVLKKVEYPNHNEINTEESIFDNIAKHAQFQNR